MSKMWGEMAIRAKQDGRYGPTAYAYRKVDVYSRLASDARKWARTVGIEDGDAAEGEMNEQESAIEVACKKQKKE